MIRAYLSISERCCKHSTKMWWVQRKSISIFSASAFNTKNADILLFSIRWIHNCVLCLNETMSRTHLNVYYLFRAWSCLADSDIKNHQIMAIWQSTSVDESFSKVMRFCSFNNAPVSLRGPLSPAPFLMESWANGCSNETNAHCVLPPSRYTKHQINECVMDGFWCDWQQRKYIWKLSDLLKFLRCLIFSRRRRQ